MTLQEAIAARHSVRKYIDKPIPQDIIDILQYQTVNMAKEGKMIAYTYYHRLTGTHYPDHPENNVKYYYGGRNAFHKRIGRLMMRENGTGAIEYFYGKMGEVTRITARW